MSIKNKIAVMQAYEDGAAIDYRMSAKDGWSPVTIPGWNWGEFDYRVTPIKKTVWINLYQDSPSMAHTHNSKQQADQSAMSNRIACLRVTYIEGEGL